MTTKLSQPKHHKSLQISLQVTKTIVKKNYRTVQGKAVFL